MLEWEQTTGFSVTNNCIEEEQRSLPVMEIPQTPTWVFRGKVSLNGCSFLIRVEAVVTSASHAGRFAKALSHAVCAPEVAALS